MSSQSQSTSRVLPRRSGRPSPARKSSLLPSPSDSRRTLHRPDSQNASDTSPYNPSKKRHRYESPPSDEDDDDDDRSLSQSSDRRPAKTPRRSLQRKSTTNTQKKRTNNPRKYTKHNTSTEKRVDQDQDRPVPLHINLVQDSDNDNEKVGPNGKEPKSNNYQYIRDYFHPAVKAKNDVSASSLFNLTT